VSEEEIDSRLLRLIAREVQRKDVGVDVEQQKAMKAAVKEAIKQFLDEKWTDLTSTFGKWVIGLIAAAVLVGIVWLILVSNGWKHP
jgi:hypothetical protein